ncbi:MAG: 50S ribosomal protein L11 methyltransferase [Xanthobacteraceae bacterium]
MDNASAITVLRLPVTAARAQHLAEHLAEEVEGVAASAAFDDGARWWIELQFGAPPDEPAVRAAIARILGDEAAGAAQFETIVGRDWVADSLAGLKPVEAGRFVVHGSHDRGRVPPNRIAIEIDAALAFGTGHHATTRGCLLALDDLHKRGQKKRRRTAPADRSSATRRPRKRGGASILRPVLLDVGTGSGVLAIAAAKAWRRPVLASDIDGTAVRIARDNARRNGVAFPVRVIDAAGVSAGVIRQNAPYPLIAANILLAPLKRLAPPLARLVAPGGRLILSGVFLAGQADAALAAYRSQGLRLARRITLEGWVTLILARDARAVSAIPLRSRSR